MHPHQPSAAAKLLPELENSRLVARNRPYRLGCYVCYVATLVLLACSSGAWSSWRPGWQVAVVSRLRCRLPCR
jgi:hypothetical protein